MDVKKYMGYLPLCMLSIIIVFSLLVYSKRNDFAIGLSTVAAQEHKSVGDPNAIRDLKYSFYIMDDYPSSRNICTGKHMARGCGWGYIYNHL